MKLSEQIQINRSSAATFQEQIKTQITWLIAGGQLVAGDKLPSIRDMADHLDVSLHTVRYAYQQLEVDGLVKTRQGRGTHVTSFDLVNLLQSESMLPSHTVGVVLPTWENPFYHRFMQGAEVIAEEDQTMFLFCTTHDDSSRAWRSIARLIAKNVDGLLIVSHNIQTIMDPQKGFTKLSGLPVVLADAPGYEGYSVQVDLEDAGYKATHHLLDLGHKRIGLITHAEELHNVKPLNDGYQHALVDAGIQIDQNLISRVPGFDSKAGSQGMRELLSLNNAPTAIFAFTDLAALGAMQVINKEGLRIPGDISIVGFNDIPSAKLVEPHLTTVAAPSLELGQMAMKMLQTLIKGTEPIEHEIVLPVVLKVRQSSAQLQMKLRS